MTRELAPIDVSAMPDVARLAQEVARTRTPIVLREGGEDVAVLSPAPAKRRRAAKPVTDADIATALGASWEGLVDPDALKRELDEARSDDRPAPRL